MSKLLLLLLVAMTLLTTGLARGATLATHELTGFRTPNRAALCVVTQLGAQTDTKLTCWTPNDGFTVRMTVFSEVTKEYLKKNRGNRETYWPGLLSFGERWYHWSPGLSQYGCVSRRTGLTCTNHDGHGWWLGRYRGYRIF